MDVSYLLLQSASHLQSCGFDEQFISRIYFTIQSMKWDVPVCDYKNFINEIADISIQRNNLFDSVINYVCRYIKWHTQNKSSENPRTCSFIYGFPIFT